MASWFATGAVTGAAGGAAARALAKGSETASGKSVVQADGARPDPYFQYNARPLQDLRGSVAWTPDSSLRSGTAANEQVTSDYQHLNAEMQKYLAGDPKGKKLPAVTDFAGMAKFGSRLAGEQIRNLEDLEKAAHGDPKAATDALRNLSKPQPIEQGLKMGADNVARNASDENPIEAALLPLPFTAGKIAGETAADTVNTMGKMRDVLVEGNTTIHDSAGRAYDAFLKGESSGRGGLESLREAGYFPGSKEDPMGMYTQAFGQYKQAREIGLQAQTESDPAKRSALLKQREEMMKEANIKLFIHEQKSLEKPHMYGDKDIKNAVQSIGGSMTLEDPHGEYRLLPNGGDWTDFEKRMGFDSVAKGTQGAIEVLNPSGPPSYYKVNPKAEGTVSHYSNSRTAGSLAGGMKEQPRPLHEAPTTATGVGVDRVGTELSNGNYLKAAGSALQVPDRLLADGASQGGKAVKDNALDYGSSAYQQMTDPKAGLLDQAGGAVKMTGAAFQHLAGEGIEAVGSGLNWLSEARDGLWNTLFE